MSIDRLDIGPIPGPHASQSVFVDPAFGDHPAGTIIALHGRYADAAGITQLARVIDPSTRWNVVAPQAAGATWYPHSFLAPIQHNEPYLSSALSLVRGIVDTLVDTEHTWGHICLIGFSQGACLALEFAARHGAKVRGVVGFSGGLIGPPGTEFNHRERRDQLTVFLGCSDVDPHIPLDRVRETGQVFERLGSSVVTRIYPGMGHTINDDELEGARRVLSQIEEAAPASSI